MVIDLLTRIWASPDQFGPETAALLRLRQADRWVRLDASATALDRAVSCVDLVAIHGFRADRLGACVPNELIAETVRLDPSRRIGIAGIDPMGADPIGQIESARQLGLVGVSVSPLCQGFHPTHSTAMRVYEHCAEAGLPVFVSRGAPLGPSTMLEFGRPGAWDEVARTFPTLPIVIGELGYPWIDETLVLAGKHTRVFTELSGVVSRPWQLYNALLTAASLGVMEKLLLGSNFPYELPAKAIENLYSLNAYGHGTQLPSVPRSAVRAIVERDSLACLGLDLDGLISTPRNAANAGDESVHPDGDEDDRDEPPDAPPDGPADEPRDHTGRRHGSWLPSTARGE